MRFKMFATLLFGMLSAILVSLAISSCSKEVLTAASPTYELEYNIPVYEQENVSHYNVEISPDGKEYTTIGVIFASTAMEDNYKININVTRFFTYSETIYTRIKSNDINGKFMYSPVYRVQKE